MKGMACLTAVLTLFTLESSAASAQAARPASAVSSQPIVLHAARLFEVVPGRIVSPGEVLV
ncbi:MAG TPA: hypothetical protein VLI40_12810, partial [Gemmatimonadaceae bacterium]|nr:hypothetical protein [Gemmatimonadaceae bacterium]